MDAQAARIKKRSMTAAELREHLKQPPEPGRAERQLRAIFGAMTEQEADELERRIDEMNEWSDGFGKSEI